VPVAFDDRLSLVEHLTELRRRIFACLIALGVAIVVAAVFNRLIFRLLVYPLHRLPPSKRHITTFSPVEPFMISLKVWAYAGIIVVSPFFLYQFWAFVGPAFSSARRRAVLFVVGVSSLLFLGGVAFCYLLVAPRGLQWLLSFNARYFSIQNRAQDYFSFIAWFLLAFGAVFELPVALLALVKLGIIDHKFLRRHWRPAVVLCSVVAAFGTPTNDAFSMLAMLVPLVVLYVVAAFVARFIKPIGHERPGRAAVPDPEWNEETPA
jgi:sec-independent protein translocase protein TatC